MREKGYFSLDDVETVFLEQNGDLSVLPKDKKRPATPDDLKIIVHQTRPESVVITDGKILEKNLAESGFNLEWLKKNSLTTTANGSKMFFSVCVMIRETSRFTKTASLKARMIFLTDKA